MRFNTTKRGCKKLEPRVHVWKLKEEKICEEYKCMVRDKVEEAEWKCLAVNKHWQQMKKYIDRNSKHHIWIVKRSMQT